MRQLMGMNKCILCCLEFEEEYMLGQLMDRHISRVLNSKLNQLGMLMNTLCHIGKRLGFESIQQDKDCYKHMHI